MSTKSNYMKTITLILALALNTAFLASGQETLTASLNMIQNREIINFTVPHEVNVRHYRVEASNDNANFEVIGTFASQGNSVMPRNYSYELLDPSYKYYRVGVVGMNATLQYSAVLTPHKEMPNSKPAINPEPLTTESSIVRLK